MSDGVTSCIYDKASNTMAPSSIKLLNYLESNTEVATQKKIKHVIEEFVKKHTFDDCSIALLRKKHYDLVELLESKQLLTDFVYPENLRISSKIRRDIQSLIISVDGV